MSLTDDERAELLEFRRRALLELIGDISEDCWAAGWSIGIEGVLYRITFEGATPEYGMGKIHERDREELCSLANKADCWFRWSETEGEPVPISLEEAKTRYRRICPEGMQDPGAGKTVQEVVDLYEASRPEDWIQQIETDEVDDGAMTHLVDWFKFAREIYGCRLDLLVSLVRRHDGKFDLRYGYSDVRIVEPSWLPKEFPRADGCSQEKPCRRVRRCVACAEAPEDPDRSKGLQWT